MKKIFLAFLAIFVVFSLSSVYAGQNDIYVEHTKNAALKISDFTVQLNSFTDNMISSGKATTSQKSQYDKKISDFESYLKNDKYIVYQYQHSGQDAENDIYLNYNYEPTSVDASSWDKNINITNEINEYFKAIRRYRINVLLYTNNYKNIPAYLANYANKPAGTYSLDGMVVNVINKDYVSIDISNANYTISNGDANSYYYGYIKFTSPKGNTYFFTGYSPSGDWNGYFVPTASGLALNCEYGGRKTFLLNTEKKSKLVENESLMLSDVFFNKYLKQASVNYTYKGIKFTGNGNKKYTITIPNLYHKEVSNFGKISENYSQSGQSSSGQWECISVGSNGYYWLKNQKNREATNVAIDEKNNITITYNDMTIQINVNK